MTAQRLAARTLTAGALLVLAGIAAVLLVAPAGWSARLLVGDDAGYYLAIARNVCLGYGASFDRLHLTNGFNPLETVLLAGADRLLARDPSVAGCYRAGMLVSFLAFAGGVWFLARLLRRFLDPVVFAGDRRRLAIAACVAFAVFFLGLKKQHGMDAALVLLLGNLYLDRVMRGGLLAPGTRTALGDGAVLGLLFLARVDTLPLLAAAFAGMALIVGSQRGAWGALAGRLAACAAVTAPYLLWSTATFGTWMPISARIKSTFPHVDLGASVFTLLHSSVPPVDLLGFAIAFAAGVAMLALGLARVARREGAAMAASPRAAVLGVLAAYVVARLSFMLLFSRHDVQPGYATLAHVFNLLVLFQAAAWAARAQGPRLGRAPALASALVVLAAFVLLAGKARVLARQAADPAMDEPALAAAIRAHTESHDVLFGGAFGLVSFFADRAWINGDGVANDLAYQQAIRDGRLREYLWRNGVTHVVAVTDHSVADAETLQLTVRSVIYGVTDTVSVPSGPLALQARTTRGAEASLFLLAHFPPAPVPRARASR